LSDNIDLSESDLFLTERMQIIKTINKLRTELNKKHTQSVGLVPTMGALHEGHLSLVRKAKEECDVVVVSIFVNPTQFSPTEDFETYPRDLERDVKYLDAEGVDYIFVPEVTEMYNEKALTVVRVEKITNILCGASRPTHFQGVTTVVSKLFNIVKPKKAYFGQKDYQQVLVIRTMVRDLNFSVEVVMCPIVRESNGLALSSRNMYLSAMEREEAVELYHSLKMAQKLIQDGERSVETLKSIIWRYIEDNTSGKIDYVEILNALNLSEIEIIKFPVVVALAVKFKKARLIDNVIIDV